MSKMNDSYIRNHFNLYSSKNNRKVRIELRKNILVTHDQTSAIKDYVMEENWGPSNKRLYSYLDYTFRARCCDKQIFVFQFSYGQKIGLFSTGLLERTSRTALYLIIRPAISSSKLPWTLVNGNVKDYLKTKKDIITNFGIHSYHIPNQWLYIKNTDVFHPEWQNNLDWQTIFKDILNHKKGGNTRDIILKEFEKNGIKIDANQMRQQLITPFRSATEIATLGYSKDNSYVISAVYFDKQNYKVVLQMLLNVEYPRNSGVITKFVAVLEKVNGKNMYEFKKLLNIKMAYKNARLIKIVPESWSFIETDDEDASTIKSCKKYNESSSFNTPITPASGTNTPNSNYSGLGWSATWDEKSPSLSCIVSNLPYQSEYPKFYQINKTKQICKVGGIVTESFFEEKIDPINNTKETQKPKTIIHYFASLPVDTQSELYSSNKISIVSQRRVYEISAVESVESTAKHVTYETGKTSSSYCTSVVKKDIHGNIISFY